MISLTIGLALAVSIAIGRVRKINIGLVAIPFAYIIGAFFMHIKPSDVIDLWPSHIYRFRAAPVMLPVMIFLVSVLISALGAGYYAVMVLMAPIALLVCRKIGINPLVGALCADCGGRWGRTLWSASTG